MNQSEAGMQMHVILANHVRRLKLAAAREKFPHDTLRDPHSHKCDFFLRNSVYAKTLKSRISESGSWEVCKNMRIRFFKYFWSIFLGSL